MFNLGSSYFHVALTTVRHLLNVTKRGLDTSRQLAVIEQRSLLTRRSNRKNKNNFRWGQMSGEGRGGQMSYIRTPVGNKMRVLQRGVYLLDRFAVVTRR